jgi:Protein of unknown function (DUF3667)
MIAVADDHCADPHTAGGDAPAWATACLNCGTALSGPFCSRCGQNAAPPHPSVHELAHDALEQFAHWDGKVGATLRCLIAHPGALTCDVLAGRRARYVSPLRLYLTCSVVYFLLSASAPGSGPNFNVSVQGTRTNNKVRVVGSAAQLTDQERAQVLASVDKAPRLMRPLAHRSLEDPRGLQRDMFETLPKILFALLPVFAGILALFYHRRRFVEHLYFALHLHAFMFIAICVGPLARFVPWPPLQIAAGVAVLVWIPVYAHLAFRRVYGSTHLVTALKETGVSVLYGLASIPAIAAAAIWVGFHPH